eukprot:2142115-Prymnesium_polylepis.1
MWSKVVACNYIAQQIAQCLKCIVHTCGMYFSCKKGSDLFQSSLINLRPGPRLEAVPACDAMPTKLPYWRRRSLTARPRQQAAGSVAESDLVDEEMPQLQPALSELFEPMDAAESTLKSVAS